MAARRGRSRRYYCVLRPICYLLHGLLFRSFLPYYNGGHPVSGGSIYSVSFLSQLRYMYYGMM